MEIIEHLRSKESRQSRLNYDKTNNLIMCTAKTQIRLIGCPDCSESPLGMVKLLVLLLAFSHSTVYITTIWSIFLNTYNPIPRVSHQNQLELSIFQSIWGARYILFHFEFKFIKQPVENLRGYIFQKLLLA